jgi:hypothetical protein
MRTVVAAVRSLAAYVGVSLYVAITAPVGIVLALIFRWKGILYIFGHGAISFTGFTEIRYENRSVATPRTVKIT